MNMAKIKLRKNDKRLKAFIQDITTTLQAGNRTQIKGFGTFSICTRKATKDRAACKMAMFRASTELRDYSMGGSLSAIESPHAEIIHVIIDGMQSEEGINIPNLGRMAVVPVSGKNPKIIFHGADELNSIL